MTKLTLKYEEFGVITEKTVENVEHLDQVVLYMDEFLRGCGFVYEGNLELSEQPISTIIDDLLKDDGQLEFQFPS